MKHTKGKWILENVESEKTLVYVKIRTKDNALAFAGVYKQKNKEEAQANARLIAAAPEMLDALKRIENIACSTNDGRGMENIRLILVSAFAKAEGK